MNIRSCVFCSVLSIYCMHFHQNLYAELTETEMSEALEKEPKPDGFEKWDNLEKMKWNNEAKEKINKRDDEKKIQEKSIDISGEKKTDDEKELEELKKCDCVKKYIELSDKNKSK